jgi:DNA-binding IscR family transcriptional regulator
MGPAEISRQIPFEGPANVRFRRTERVPVQNLFVHIPAKVDYGMCALLALAERGEPATAQVLAQSQGLPPNIGAAEHLQDVWVAVRAGLRRVLDTVTLEDVIRGKLPRSVAKLIEDPDAWAPRR